MSRRPFPASRSGRQTRAWCAGLVATLSLCCQSWGEEDKAASRFKQEIQPILSKYCYDCHGDGVDKGGIAFDELKPDSTLLNHDLWSRVLKNVRADMMPPAKKKERPTAEERKQIENWIKYAAFGIDPKNIDPGRVTVRRLNRVEYRNTIHDLMGIDFKTEVEFPPDDTGYGFDNIGDVLTVSPMLLEKYLAAAKTIVAEAVPTVSRVMPERVIGGTQFQSETNSASAGKGPSKGRSTMLPLSFEKPAAVATSFQTEKAGSYQFVLELAVNGGFYFDKSKCRVAFKMDDHELLNQEFGWHDNKTFRFEYNQQWEPGQHRMSFNLEPTAPSDQETNVLQMRIVSVTVRGPMEREHWAKPPNYDRFFTREAPADPVQRRQYAHEVMNRFATKAFRRPVDDKTVDRLVTLAESIYSQPGKTFETGIGYAFAAVLASPRFLFRLEESEPNTPRGQAYANVDEYSLASRLSYFLWSTMPDEELIRIAERGELRKNLRAQIKRMMDDPRSDELVENFTGQWLQTRDVDGIAINARQVLARDDGTEKQLKEQIAAFQARQAARTAQARANQAGATNAASNLTNALAGLPGSTNAPGQTNRFAQGNRGRGRGLFGPPRVELDGDLRNAMKRETQMAFNAVVHEDRSVTELIDSDYTFLNEKLARLYGITNVTGSEMRRVTLPPDSSRGGLLTHGSVLVVTSNPDRTSPVKRGLFVLENVLGTPAPPPPANVPALEATEKDFKDHEPTLRESLQAHREKPLCNSCHSRMDPIGLAFENFNAMGMWREKERNQTIDTAGQLITGESFNGVRELKRLLANERRNDFYRCFTEKLLTYALGRGLDYYDAETVDQIVQQLDKGNGRFLPMLTSIIESAPFQKQRTQASATSAEATDSTAKSTQLSDNRRLP